SRMVESIGIGDQRVNKCAEVQQVVPIAIVAGHARDFDRKHDTDMAQPHLSNESFESNPRYAEAAAAHSKVFIDHHHLASWPAHADGPIHQTVLLALALSVVLDLAR